MHSCGLVAAGVAVLAALPAAQAGIYTKSSPVVQVDAKSYDRLIAKSNYTSIVEFYAPWCGHCQNLKPAYEKAAKNLEGLAKVAAVDCDDDANKPLCGSMGVKGFPTLKIVRPSKKAGGRPVVEDYNGARTATAIVEAVVDKINNHVTRLTDKDLDAFLAANKDKPKAILFTEKGTTSALLRSIAIDFLGVISVAQVRDKETATVGKFGVDKFPTLLLVPAGDGEPVAYDGELKKAAMVAFLKQAGEPNPDPAPIKGTKPDRKSEKKADKKAEPKAEKKKEAPPEGASTAGSESASSEKATASPPPASSPAIPALATQEELIKECMNARSNACVLALVPTTGGELSDRALASLAELANKYAKGQRQLFPFFEVPDSNAGAAEVRKSLELGGEVAVIALNARRGWWRLYEGDFSVASVEGWIDAIRMSEGVKKKLPEGLVATEMEGSTEAASGAKAEPSATPIKHEEL